MIEQELKKSISENYLIDIVKIENNEESTVGNVYIIYTEFTKYVVKIYDDLKHTISMVNLHIDLSTKFTIPKVILSKCNDGYIQMSNKKYVVVYSFLNGIQIAKLDNFDKNIVKEIASELRKIHGLTSNLNKYDLGDVPFCEGYNLERKSLLHFDLTTHNIFYNNGKIGFIDFDDAKYGPAICDVAILIGLLFFSKKRGVDIDSLNLFIDTYYNSDIELKLREVKYIKEFAINWINYIMSGNEFDTSIKESFEVKKELIEKYM